MTKIREVVCVGQDVVIFLFFVVALGLLQAWVIVMLKIHYQPELYLEEIFDDGSIFFYASSLFGGAIYSILAKENLVGRRALALLIFMFVVLVAISGAYYGIDTKEMLDGKYKTHSEIMPKMDHLHFYLELQVICAFVAITVALAIAVQEISSLRKETKAEKEASPSASGLRPSEGGGETVRQMAQRQNQYP